MSRAPRYRARVDENQKAVVRALEKIGASVWVIGRPVDLLVGYRGVNWLLEVKNPDSRYGKEDRGTKEQRRVIDEWRGKIVKVYGAEEAIVVVQSEQSND